MKYIEKGEEPEILAQYKKKHPYGTYDDAGFKSYVFQVRNTLVEEQHEMCAYCCRKISDSKSHIEHIEPRHTKDGTMSARSLDYTNMVASCNNGKTCGRAKGNAYDSQKFISPLDQDCEDRIRYDLFTGMVEKTDDNSYTVDLLNLNFQGLIDFRRNISILLEEEMDADGTDEDMLDDIAESYVEMYGFADYIGQYMEFVRNKADSV